MNITEQIVTSGKGLYNEMKLHFTDITNEASRTYIFPTGEVTIKEPVKLNIKRKPEGDSHRIINAAQESYYIPVGWIAIKWIGKEGSVYTF